MACDQFTQKQWVHPLLPTPCNNTVVQLNEKSDFEPDEKDSDSQCTVEDELPITDPEETSKVVGLIGEIAHYVVHDHRSVRVEGNAADRY